MHFTHIFLSIMLAPFSTCLGQNLWNHLWFFTFFFITRFSKKSFWFYHQDLSGIWHLNLTATRLHPLHLHYSSSFLTDLFASNVAPPRVHSYKEIERSFKVKVSQSSTHSPPLCFPISLGMRATLSYLKRPLWSGPLVSLKKKTTELVTITLTCSIAAKLVSVLLPLSWWFPLSETWLSYMLNRRFP